MSAMIETIDSAALVLGYLVLLIWVIFIIWIVTVLVREVRYDAKKKRYAEKVQSESKDTDVLEFTVDDIYDYQKEKWQ